VGTEKASEVQNEEVLLEPFAMAEILEVTKGDPALIKLQDLHFVEVPAKTLTSKAIRDWVGDRPLIKTGQIRRQLRGDPTLVVKPMHRVEEVAVEPIVCEHLEQVSRTWKYRVPVPLCQASRAGMRCPTKRAIASTSRGARTTGEWPSSSAARRSDRIRKSPLQL
jgi:hypothetical protein